MLEWIIAIIVIALILASIKVLNQWEMGIVLTLGKYSRTAKPGLNLIVPLIQQLIKVDLRISTIDIPKQEVITKDNVPVQVNAVVYFRVEKPEDAIMKIQDYGYAVSQYAQTALRDVVGNISLDELLTERDKIAVDIQKIVDKETVEWGIDVTAIKMQDIELPQDMKRAMARQAEAEREKRATIIHSQGELAAAANISKAAAILSKNPASIHLRTLQTLIDVAPEHNTIVFVTPIEMLEALKGIAGLGKKKD
jgi:regulator of protease activity HflC (stomatin/prohibitin superfamily)